MTKKTIIAVTVVILAVVLVFYATASTENDTSKIQSFKGLISELIDEQNQVESKSSLIDPKDHQKEIWTLESKDPKLEVELTKKMEKSEPDEKIGVIILLKSRQSTSSVSSMESQKSVISALRGSDGEIKYQYHIINGITAMIPARSIKAVADRSDVECVYLDREIQLPEPPEPRKSYGGIHSAGTARTTEDQVWDEEIDGRGIVVAVIDTGIDKNHPDLYGKVVSEKNFVEDEPTTDDLYGHGTHCAGIIAGTGEASGGRYKGVAPGASLMNIRVLDSEGSGYLSDVIAGIEWAVDNGADVISISLGGSYAGDVYAKPDCMAVDSAMDAGVVVCVAAGNSG
ncbi:MAG: S8 family serine peptidase [Nitrospiraceae bacterium]|nr:S8 family serine peptidase [Nitrospiraceae bacterium]